MHFRHSVDFQIQVWKMRDHNIFNVFLSILNLRLCQTGIQSFCKEIVSSVEHILQQSGPPSSKDRLSDVLWLCYFSGQRKHFPLVLFRTKTRKKNMIKWKIVQESCKENIFLYYYYYFLAGYYEILLFHLSENGHMYMESSWSLKKPYKWFGFSTFLLTK